MKTWMVFVLFAALVAGCVQTGTVDSKSSAGIPDDEIGLSKVDIFEIPEPISFNLTEVEPGDAKLPLRAFFGSPPVIAHNLEDMLPITRSENACIDCHEVETKEPGEPTPIPESHYVDLRNAPGKKQEQVVGARYNCTLCHAMESNTEPLVKSLSNRF